MMVEILFHNSMSPKIVDAAHVYTKGGLLCVELKDSQIIHKYPLLNIFSVTHKHGNHMGCQSPEEAKK